MSLFEKLASELRALESIAKSAAPPARDINIIARIDLEKSAPDQQLVWGWAYVNEIDGKPVIDSQGDYLPDDVLVQAANDFMTNYRVALSEHQGEPVGEVVQSLVFTKALQVSLGINLNKVGWLICMKINDPQTWEQIKSGQKNAFSIGGSTMWDIAEQPNAAYHQA